MNTEAMQRDLS